MTQVAKRDDRTIRYRGTGFYASVIAVLVIATGLLIFAVQNTAAVTIEWLWLDVTAPLFAWVIGAALLAIIVSELVGLVWRARERGRLATRERHLRVVGDDETGPTRAETEAETPSTTSDLAQQTHHYDEARR